jgi:hypothetical protein
LVNQLTQEIGNHVEENLNNFFKKPTDVLQNHQNLITAKVFN